MALQSRGHGACHHQKKDLLSAFVFPYIQQTAPKYIRHINHHVGAFLA